MRAAILKKPGEFELREVERPTIREGQALVRVRYVGVCGTDLHAYEGVQPFFTFPRILGHEIAAEVVEIAGDANGWTRGEACVVLPYLNCGTCIACWQGKTNCCATLETLGVHVDGGMREYITVPTGNLVKADGLTAGQMALVENQSIGAHAVRRAQLQEGEWALVVGMGPIGIGVIQFARLSGAKVIALDVDEGRLDFCRKTLGVEHTILVRSDPRPRLAELTNGDYPTAVFEATGNPGSMMAAFNYVAHGGRLILVSLVQADITFHDPDLHRRELTVMSSRNATRQDFERVIDAMRKEEVVTQPLNTHRVSLDGMSEQFPHWLKREAGVIKAIVEM